MSAYSDYRYAKEKVERCRLRACNDPDNPVYQVQLKEALFEEQMAYIDLTCEEVLEIY